MLNHLYHLSFLLYFSFQCLAEHVEEDNILLVAAYRFGLHYRCLALQEVHMEEVLETLHQVEEVLEDLEAEASAAEEPGAAGKYWSYL